MISIAVAKKCNWETARDVFFLGSVTDIAQMKQSEKCSQQ
jgi:hypothetical protein